MDIASRFDALLATLVASLMLCGVRPTRARADDQPPAVARAAAATAPQSAEGISRLVGQLDSDAFATRNDAAERLVEIGRPVVAPLARAVPGQSLEQTTAAIHILGEPMNSKSSDTDTRRAARTALEAIANGNTDTAASLAADTLHPPAANRSPANPFPVQMANAIPMMRFRRRFIMRGGVVQPMIVVAPALAPNAAAKPNPPARAIPAPRPAPPAPAPQSNR